MKYFYWPHDFFPTIRWYSNTNFRIVNVGLQNMKIELYIFATPKILERFFAKIFEIFSQHKIIHL